MAIVVVCERFGWTYLEYLAQPYWFITLIHKKLDIDSQKERAAQEKAQRRSPKK